MSSTAPIQVEYGHVESSPVNWDELDAFGMLHHSRYATLLERALSAYWTGRGFDLNSYERFPDSFHVVRELLVTYHQPIKGSGPRLVHFWFDSVGRTSAEYGFRVLSPDGATVNAEGRRVVVRLDPATLRPTPWTDLVRPELAKLLRPGSAER
ncbi:acyl-CoA thioesterase [Micromonospora sp. WP24]|uniref:acyl-CoA thioesterase n=1 Tax=Micromonospora sp. WP24 TaxID=2604469 RepID=UPI0011D431D4|nr:hotdog domain-containing protein [Micromonospora sp. WP24]TYC05133.1 acyl-CoA thioesterase [Micromonospora sp. WP24]